MNKGSESNSKNLEYKAGNIRQLVLNKGNEKYIFKCEKGDESALLDALVASATNPELDFDWFDAAVLSFRLTQTLIDQADGILYNPEPPYTPF